jgi:predicted  nucleic acid-binding Zn-ribbon protein
LAKELETKQAGLKARSVNLDAQWADFHAKNDALEAQKANLTSPELDARWAELNARIAEFDAQTADLNAQAAELNARESKIESKQLELTSSQSEIENRQADLDARASEIEKKQSELDAHIAELEAERSDFDEQRIRWRKQQAEKDSHIDVSAEKELEEESSTEPEFNSPEEKAPIDLKAIFERIGAKVDFSEEESPEDQPTPHKPIAREAEPTPPAFDERRRSTRSATEEEDESVDSYMSRLMERVRGTIGSTDTPQVFDRQQARSEPPVSQPQKNILESAPKAAPLPQAQREPVVISPRATAPEKHINLMAMRELANLSAKSALNRHDRTLLVNTIYSKLAVISIALFSAIALLWMCYVMECPTHTFFAAIVALLTAVLWGIQYAFLTGRLIIKKSGEINWNDKSESEEAKGTDSSTTEDENPSSVAIEEKPQEDTETAEPTA